ncbi:hypothetical protein UA32_12275 [Photobacterium angustum]|uniref:Uncharacterized protein n=1 Tax=Photobacterium angustum TaxID=661 RepID=A0ABX5GYF7_PHOAN|nr:hypothetical protein UA32_12275 [Photobacterium angustum]PSX03937.1 hypothetical protein C0W27_20805 [Photobacterium angustum]
MKGFDEIFLTRAANSQWIRVDDLKNRGWTDAMLADFSRKKSVRSLDFGDVYRAEFVFAYERKNKSHMLN